LARESASTQQNSTYDVRTAVSQSRLENRVQPLGLGRVAGDAVGDVLGGVARKVVGLALHRAQAGILPEEPLDGDALLLGVRGEDLVLGVLHKQGTPHYYTERAHAIQSFPYIVLGQVEEDRTRLEHGKVATTKLSRRARGFVSRVERKEKSQELSSVGQRARTLRGRQWRGCGRSG